MAKILDEEWTRNGLSDKFTPDGLAIANTIREFSPKLHQVIISLNFTDYSGNLKII